MGVFTLLLPGASFLTKEKKRKVYKMNLSLSCLVTKKMAFLAFLPVWGGIFVTVERFKKGVEIQSPLVNSVPKKRERMTTSDTYVCEQKSAMWRRTPYCRKKEEN